MPSYPQGDLETPFLKDELFIGETGAGLEPRLAALEAESPFQHAFEQGQPAVDQEDGGSPRMMESEGQYEPSAAPQSFVGEEQYESLDTELHPEWFAQRLEPSGEEEGSAETEHFHDALQPFQNEEIAEQLESPSDLSPSIADALRNSDWVNALKLAIGEGWRDENKLTNLIFFARHFELAGGKLDPKHPKFKQLSREWIKIRDREVWPVIQKSAENTALAVAGKDVAVNYQQFWGKSGNRFKDLIEQAAKEVDLNPGLLAATLLAETGTASDYLTKNKVRSYRIGVDDFYDMRHAVAKRVPAYAKISWDRKQKPVVHWNDAKKPRLVKTIEFDSGPAALLASAVYLKYGEVRLREEAAKLGGDFDKLPVETRWALIRMALNAGVGGATKRLAKALKGEDILVRKNLPRKAYQTERNATIHTARALHLSEWIFGVPPAATVQPEVEELDLEEWAVDDEAEDVDRRDFETTMDSEYLASERGTETEVGEEVGDDETNDGIEAQATTGELETEEEEFYSEDVTYLEREPLTPIETWIEPEDEEDIYPQEEATYNEEALTNVVYPSGESLPVLTGLPEGKGEDYWDPTGSGNPLLNTGPLHKDKKLSANYTVRELTTSGGVSADVARIDPKLVVCLQKIRDHVGRAVTITSGYRSWKRNKEIYQKRGREPTHSQHCAGRAADIKIRGMNGLQIGKAAIDACGPNIGVGLGNTFAHIDVRGYAEAWDYGGVEPRWIKEIKDYQQAKRRQR